MSSKRHHAEWLSLVEVSGPFLTMPVLERVFPQGLDAHDPELYRNLRLAYEEWEENPTKSVIHRSWIKYVLEQMLGLPEEVLVEGQTVPEALKATVSEHGETLRPDFVVRNPEDLAPAGQVRLLIQVYPLEQDLEKPVAERHWKASPATRMMELLHATDVRLGLVTNGERWMMVYAPRGETTGYASWYASLWMEEKITLQAFRSLLGVHRFFNAPDDQTLDAMLAESAKHQHEVTDQLGYQVRRAVETLIQSLDRADQDSGRALLARVPEAELYEAALTVMMRLVFLFCAEERDLLLLGDPLYDQHYAVSTLIAQLQEAADQHGEEVLERRLDAWSRLLATFRGVYGGIEHERLKLLAYGGRLFDPDRFPFLEGRAAGTRWRETPANPVPVNNRTTLHLLRSLQYLEMQGEARRLSFRALDIEQIGHVYEGLLDHTAKRAAMPVLGLIGPKGDEPEIELTELESLREKGRDDLIDFLREQTGKSENTLRRLLEAELDTHEINQLRAACGNDGTLFNRARPFAALVRADSFDRPIVIPEGSVYVTAGTDRRSSGTHYTPRSLTEPIAQYTLEPLVYAGPAEGKPKDEWRLRSPRELLDLKICDMACGSGAFLVQACRYLSERLVEAWEEIEQEQPGASRITPEGAAATGALDEALIPQETNERMSYAQRIIAQRCLYGVDKNPLAVEMAKLSLWLLTLAKAKPFTFLDHAIRRGDSLVGIKDLDQLRYFNRKTDGEKQLRFSGSVTALVDEVIALRRKIEASPANTVADAEAQEVLLREAEEKVARLRYAADLLIAVGFQSASAKALEDLHGTMAMKANYYVENGTLAEFKEAVRQVLHGQPTFHWPLEFPEVFVGRGGFDVFVGNPPFLGGIRVRSTLGPEYLSYLQTEWGGGDRSDLCCYFFLRAASITSASAVFGLLATNTISQGDSREFCLQRLCNNGFTIIRAISSAKWPGTASLEVAHLWISRLLWRGRVSLNHEDVRFITPFLQNSGTTFGTPKQLIANEKLSYKGVDPMGTGFLLEPEEAKKILAKEQTAREVLWPFLNGRDLYSDPQQQASRWAIYFRDWPLTRASAPANSARQFADDYPVCLSLIEERVKPYRKEKKADGS
jgi:Eco57I restriction-modification methylase